MQPTAPEPTDRIAVNQREAARLLSISERHLSNLVAAGEVRRVKSGNRNLFPIAELHRYSKDNLR